MKLPAPAIWLFTLLGGFALAVTVLGQWFGLRDVYADGRPLGIVERYENTVLRREQFYDEENDSATVSVSLRLPEKAVVQNPVLPGGRCFLSGRRRAAGMEGFAVHRILRHAFVPLQCRKAV